MVAKENHHHIFKRLEAVFSTVGSVRSAALQCCAYSTGNVDVQDKE